LTRSLASAPVSAASSPSDAASLAGGHSGSGGKDKEAVSFQHPAKAEDGDCYPYELFLPNCGPMLVFFF
jgi:hypothetical protein